MPGPAYRMIAVDLTVASSTQAGQEVLGLGVPISDVCVIELPAAAVGAVVLRIGDRSADPIPLRLEGQNFHVYDACIAGGLYVDHPTVIAGTLRLFVGINTEARI